MTQTRPTVLLTTSSRCSIPYFASWTPKQESWPDTSDYWPRIEPTRSSSSNTFSIFSVCFQFPNSGMILMSLCLDIRLDLPSPSWGSSITYPDTQSAHGILSLPIHTTSFQNSTFAPWGCQKPSMPGQLLQEHSKASSNVTVLLQSSLRLSGVHLLWTHSTSYKSPLRSSQATFFNTCCIIGTLCWALENIKITKT